MINKGLIDVHNDENGVETEQSILDKQHTEIEFLKKAKNKKDILKLIGKKNG